MAFDQIDERQFRRVMSSQFDQSRIITTLVFRPAIQYISVVYPTLRMRPASAGEYAGAANSSLLQSFIDFSAGVPDHH